MMFQPINQEISIFDLPGDVETVVNLLMRDLSLRDKVLMANLSEEELDPFYGGMAGTIRKEFRLYSGNFELLASCRSYLGQMNNPFADSAMVIIRELWKKVKQTHQLRLVRK